MESCRTRSFPPLRRVGFLYSPRLAAVVVEVSMPLQLGARSDPDAGARRRAPKLQKLRVAGNTINLPPLNSVNSSNRFSPR